MERPCAPVDVTELCERSFCGCVVESEGNESSVVVEWVFEAEGVALQPRPVRRERLGGQAEHQHAGLLQSVLDLLRDAVARLDLPLNKPNPHAVRLQPVRSLADDVPVGLAVAEKDVVAKFRLVVHIGGHEQHSDGLLPKPELLGDSCRTWLRKERSLTTNQTNNTNQTSDLRSIDKASFNSCHSRYSWSKETVFHQLLRHHLHRIVGFRRPELFRFGKRPCCGNIVDVTRPEFLH